MNTTPTFSLCHTTARLPLGWVNAAETWFTRCDHPETVEYVLGIDKGQTAECLRNLNFNTEFTRLHHWGANQFATNRARRCAVDGWNATANASNGKFLISVADDWTPCKHWDTEILKIIPSLDGQYVLDVNTGGDHGILTFSMLTRKYMERLIRDYGYAGFFYPEYLGMMADTEFGEIARMHGVVINAKHLLFPHDHPNYTGKPMDEVHQWQHRREALKTGEEVFLRRMEEIAHVTLPRFVDHPGMPPLNELFGINWEPGSLAKLVKNPQRCTEDFQSRKEKNTRYMGAQVEAKTKDGWLKCRIIIQRANGTVRVETPNHVEYEVRQQDIRQPAVLAGEKV